MKLVINHLTRMRPGFICVAGIDMESRKHVRPLPAAGRLGPDHLRRNKGPFDIAEVVEIKAPRPRPVQPETEDHQYQAGDIRHAGSMPGEDFWKLLKSISSGRLKTLFGNDLVSIGSRNCGVNVGQGSASLGCYLPKDQPVLTCPDGKKIRLLLDDADFPGLDLGVTDIRLYGSDHWTPAPAKVKAVAARIAKGEPVILSVGLGRPWSSDPERYTKMHWLQVNNLHLESDPGWALG